jgi:ketosteroid isomerase-like protein
MSQARIDTLRAGYEAFNRGDWEAALSAAHPEMELRTADRVTNPGTYRGTQEVRRFFDDLFEPFEQVTSEPEKFFERGDQIGVFVTVRSRPTGSTAEVVNRIGHLWTFRDGKIVHFQIFPAREEMLEASGLTEQDALPLPSGRGTRA